MDLLVSAHRHNSAVSGTHHRTQDPDHIRRCGRYSQINLLSQEGRRLARAACVKRCLLRCLSISTARVRICIVERDDQP
jgi:hypothetical protein